MDANSTARRLHGYLQRYDFQEYHYMEKTPVFHKVGKKKKQLDCIRNFNCEHYEYCINEAAMKDFLLDCGSCEYQLTVPQEE